MESLPDLEEEGLAGVDYGGPCEENEASVCVCSFVRVFVCSCVCVHLFVCLCLFVRFFVCLFVC